MEHWIISTMEQFGYMGVLFLIALENIFPPIPSEVILTFGGFMTTKTELTVAGVILFSTIGSTVGAIVLYGIGRCLDRSRLEKIIDKWGHILRLTKEDIYKAERWFHKRGAYTVFFCRFVPLIRSLISVPAGMAKMNVWQFLCLTISGTFIWNLVLVSIGAAVGDSWESIVSYMDMYSHVVYVLLVVIFLVCAIWFVKTRLLKKKSKSN